MSDDRIFEATFGTIIFVQSMVQEVPVSLFQSSSFLFVEPGLSLVPNVNNLLGYPNPELITGYGCLSNNPTFSIPDNRRAVATDRLNCAIEQYPIVVK